MVNIFYSCHGHFGTKVRRRWVLYCVPMPTLQILQPPHTLLSRQQMSLATQALFYFQNCQMWMNWIKKEKKKNYEELIACISNSTHIFSGNGSKLDYITLNVINTTGSWIFWRGEFIKGEILVQSDWYVRTNSSTKPSMGCHNVPSYGSISGVEIRQNFKDHLSS